MLVVTELEPVLKPSGALTLRPTPPETDQTVATEPARLEKAFARGSGHGLLSLGADEVGTTLPPALSYWRRFGVRFVSALCALPETQDRASLLVPIPALSDLAVIAAAVPPMTGAEYLTAEILSALWHEMGSAFAAELTESGLALQEFLRSRNKAWNLVGRVHFNLAENRKDERAPFAFLATYTTRLSADAKPQHLPLGRALQEYAGARNRERLLSLLTPVQRAAEQCAWLKAMVDSGEIFHPLRWLPQQAVQFLRDTALLEGAGVIVRMPATWRMNRPSSPRVKATVGGKSPSRLGMDALLDFKMEVSLDGETLTAAELEKLLSDTEGLAFIRGKWVEVDSERLKRTLDAFQKVEERASKEGLSFGEAMRLVAGSDTTAGADGAGGVAWSETVAGPWLSETLKALRHPDELQRADPGTALHGTLRPYQKAGVEWLRLLAELRLGGCLADDMGLGKTIQVLALLLALKRQAPKERKPSLLVAPASLLANWAAEMARFAPSLTMLTAHPSAADDERFKEKGGPDLADVDLVITSYGFLTRLPWLKATAWRLVVLDEAQAIKNPATRQTKSVKELRAESRLALTGTPIENRLGDLWSIFDFINPGLLGSAKEFSSFVKSAEERPENPYGPLRELVRPYILRRMKTDKTIIDDLPDKTEVKTYCPLSKRQAALYQEAVSDLAGKLEDGLEGIERRGLVLSSLMRLKQICNHPSQWLGDGGWSEEDSGKFGSLRDIVEVLASRQEKALVFTQFKETTAPLADYLRFLFGRPGLVLHGETEVKKRKELVKQFQEDEDVPFFVITVKAGGAGLNLTAASHVIHFDRWWNPAVENQATDRAFRIGQKKNVLVHKFVCRGTVEERIDSMIDSKQQLAGDFLSAGAEIKLTEMRDEELLNVVSLDLAAAMKEG